MGQMPCCTERISGRAGELTGKLIAIKKINAAKKLTHT